MPGGANANFSTLSQVSVSIFLSNQQWNSEFLCKLMNQLQSLGSHLHNKLDLYLLIIQGNGIANAELPRWTWNLAPHAALWQNGSALAPANCTSSPFSASERL